MYFEVNLTIFFDFVIGHLFAASHIPVKWWSSDKVKENCDTNLKVHFVMQQLPLSESLNNRFCIGKTCSARIIKWINNLKK